MSPEELLQKLPLGEPTKIDGQWYYLTRHSIWVLRSADDPRVALGEVGKMPVWVFHSWIDEEEEEEEKPPQKPTGKVFCPKANRIRRPARGNH